LSYGSSSGSASGSSRSQSGGTSGSSSSASSSEEDLQVSSYSATVGGKQYSGSVEKSGGEYTASVSSLSGATATGSSPAAAENNLTLRIDELV